MSSIVEKIAKQLRYQHDTGDRDQLFVDVEHLTDLVCAQMRLPEKQVRPKVKAECERLVTIGVLVPWVKTPLQREQAAMNNPRRFDHYWLVDAGRL